MAKAFGRDEMNALLGSGDNDNTTQDSSSASLLFRPPSLQQKQRRRTGKEMEPDIASLTPAETAALLLEQNSKKSALASGGTAATSSTRYRSQKVMAHHVLANELLTSTNQDASRMRERQDKNSHSHHQGIKGGASRQEEDSDQEVDNSNPIQPGKDQEAVTRRSKIEPQVISQPSKRRTYDSSSSSSNESEDSTSRKRRRQRRAQNVDDSSSSSSGSDEGDNQRRRLLERRRGNRVEPEIVAPRPRNSSPRDSKDIEPKTRIHESNHQPVLSKQAEFTAPEAAVSQKQSRNSQKPKPGGPSGRSDSSSVRNSDDSSSDDSSSGSSSSGSSSSSEEQFAIAKPLFVPKHKRHLIQSEVQKTEQEVARQQREEQRVQKRIMESRGMVVAAVQAAAAAKGADEEEDEEAGGATNAPPNDDDDINREEERDAWEMRELARLLSALDQIKEREVEQLEYERRRTMTDKECLEEDTRNGRYQRPGSNHEPSEQKTKGRHNQRFFHRGAYYQQADEWDESDVRHKAAEYARAATGDDKIDRSQLPEVMQVKNFGLARQNHKYKGLAKEDTGSITILPIVRKREHKAADDGER
jgi:microfibrillar-associated protein 1